MHTISAKDYELLGFFEVEPELFEEDVPWIDNDSVYKVNRGDVDLSFAIQPNERDVRIIMSQNGKILYELNTTGVKDVKVLNEKKFELLEIKINEEQSIILSVKPEISIKETIRQS